MTTSIGKLTTAIIFAFLLLTTTAPKAEEPAASLPPISHRIAGGEFDFIVWDSNSFTRIGSRFGESPKVLASENGKQVSDRLDAGDTVHIDNRHIVPIEAADLIEVNLPQRMLFHFEGGRLRGAYPVAIGQPGKQWRTPTGAFKVIQLQEDPTWRVPASIQREEEEAGKDVEDEVDPGPDNPLGKYWIGLSFPVIGIHGTNHPVSVYSYRTHGCVRLHPDDIEALFNDVDLNDSGVIAYYPVMLARLNDGRIFLESDRDIYRKGTGGIDTVKALARADGIDTLIDWSRAGEVLDDQEGIARDVTVGSERARGTPANSIAATTSDRKARVATDASRGIIAEELPPN